MIIKPNEFTTYEFTDAELIDAAKLTELQRAFIQHQVGVLLSEKVNMKFDYAKSLDFLQNEAYIAGQIEAFRFLLGAHEESIEKLKELMTNLSREARVKSNNLYADPNAIFHPSNSVNPNQTLGE